MLRPRSVLLAALPLLLAAACANGAADEQASDEGALGRATHGPLGLAPRIEIDRAEKGVVSGRHFNLFAIDLSRGDEITITNKKVSGDHKPDAILFRGYEHVRSSSHSTTPTQLTKKYRIAEDGMHYVAVGTYGNRGSGEYELTVKCGGGPCAGEPAPPRPLEEEEAAACISKARDCAVGKAVGTRRMTAAQASAAFDRCLEEARVGRQVPCATACARPDATQLCTDIKRMVRTYANKGAACKAQLDSCMETCTDDGSAQPVLEDGAEVMCLFGGFNGTCDGFAKQTRACGGSLVPDSREECMELCKSTSGVWMDDLDLICTESCH